MTDDNTASGGCRRSLRARLGGDGVGAVLLRGASWFLLIQLVGVGLGFGLQVLLARAMGPGGYGTYVHALRWAAALLLLGRLGLAMGSLRFVPALRAAGDLPALKGFVRSASLAVVVASFAAGGLMAAILLAVGDRLPAAFVTALLVACLALPLRSLLQVWGSMLRGFKRVLRSQLPGAVVQPLALAVIVLVWLMCFERPLEPGTAAAAHLVSVLVAVSLAGLFLRSVLPSELRDLRAVVRLGEWARVTLPLMLQNVVVFSAGRADVLFVGVLVGPVGVALYAAASRISSLLGLGMTAVEAWAAPLISELHARQRPRELERLGRRAAQLNGLFTAPLVLVLLVGGRTLLGLFGPDFADAFTALAILAAGKLVNSFVGPVGLLLSMTDHQDTSLKITGAHALVNVVLLIVLVPTYGIVGAAIAASLVRFSNKLVMALAVWRLLKVRATIL